jgi:hypothetical protein
MDCSNLCQLGCSPAAEDSLEHYSRCRVVRECHRAELGIEADWLLPVWIGADAGARPEWAAMLAAVGAYATYRATNSAWHAGGFAENAAKAAFRQAIMEAAADAPRVGQVLAGVHAGRTTGGKRATETLQQQPVRSVRTRLSVQEALALM